MVASVPLDTSRTCSHDGTRSVIGRDVLHYPGGMAIGAGGSIFVSNWSVLPAFPQAGSPFGNARGQVIRLTP